MGLRKQVWERNKFIGINTSWHGDGMWKVKSKGKQRRSWKKRDGMGAVGQTLVCDRRLYEQGILWRFLAQFQQNIHREPVTKIYQLYFVWHLKYLSSKTVLWLKKLALHTTVLARTKFHSSWRPSLGASFHSDGHL